MSREANAQAALDVARSTVRGVLGATRAPGPWKVCPMTARQFTVWRWIPGPRGSNAIERMRNANGNTKRFRSEEAAYAAIAKATEGQQ